jgi:hypothetical protein
MAHARHFEVEGSDHAGPRDDGLREGVLVETLDPTT